MGRTAIVLDRDELQNAVNQAEATQTFGTLAELWRVVAKRLNTGLSHQSVALKAKQLGVTHKTVAGRLGGGKRKSCPMPLPMADKLRKNFPPSLQTTVERAAKGSLRAAVKLHCLECSGGVRSEVANCQV